MITAIVFLIVLFLVDHLYWKRRHLPPGPTPLPVLGNMLTIAKNPPGYMPMLEWRKRYGPVFTFWFGNNPTICIADYKTIKETMIDDSETYAARSTLDDLITLVRGGHYGVVETSGWLWREQKRFMLHNFRDFGMGKNLMQQKILDEVVYLIDSLKNANDLDGHNIQADVDRAVGSIINSILFGYRYEGEKVQEFVKLKRCLTNHMRFVMEPLTTMAMTQPLTLGRLPVFKPRLDQLLGNMNELFQCFEGQIEEHRKNIDFELNDEPTDFCQAFLQEMHQRGGENEAEHSFSANQLRNMCLDLWTAGLETTTNTIAFGILYYIRHPRITHLIRKELDSVVDSDRLITVDDKSSLPYLNAFISETQRMANLLPINLIRKTTKDTTINGYHIPRGSSVIPQIGCVLYDETIFPDPFTFKPERFINEQGQLIKIEENIPFSIGKRQCMGEALARMELFILFSNLFNQFEFYAEDGKNLPTAEKRFGFALQPHPFKCQIRSRFND